MDKKQRNDKSMKIIVQKYGGTSIGTIERINAVADKIAKNHKKDIQIVVVVSAMSGETNRLIELAYNVNETPPEREMDVLLSTGEQVTIALLSMALLQRKITTKSYAIYIGVDLAFVCV